MIKFCEEQAGKCDEGHSNFKELMLSSIMSEQLIKVRKDLQIPDNMVKNLLPLSGNTLHDTFSQGLLPTAGEFNAQIDLNSLENFVHEPITFEDLANCMYFKIIVNFFVLKYIFIF